jgi:sirohydrochlorin ferrochelatase
MLSATLGSRVELAFAISGTHWVGDVVARLRKRGAERVAVASYLLADGLFQDRLYTCGADVVTDPLGRHPGVAKLVAHRFRTARLSLAA